MNDEPEVPFPDDAPEVELWAAILRARKRIPAIPKTATNPFHNSKYAPLDAVQAVVDPILWDEGLLLVGAGDGRTWAGLTVILTTTGARYTARIALAGLSDMQKVGGGYSYARRYAYAHLFDLVLDDDDDGNMASGLSGSRTSAPAPRPAPASRPAARPQQRPASQAPRASVDVSAVEALIDQIDAATLAEEGEGAWQFRSNRGDGKVGIFGKVAKKLGLAPKFYSLAEIASQGKLPALEKHLRSVAYMKGILDAGNRQLDDQREAASPVYGNEPPPPGDEDNFGF